MVATGRCFIADISLDTYKQFQRSQDDLEEEALAKKNTHTGSKLGLMLEERPLADEFADLTSALRSVPRSLVLSQGKGSRNVIKTEFIESIAKRESMCLSNEPELLAQKKRLCIVKVV